MVTKLGKKVDDILIGGNGNDVLKGLAGNDTLIGGGGNDTLDGALGDDELLGGDGNDLLLPGKGGFDAIDGGKGIDTVSFANFDSTAGIQITGTSARNVFGSRDADGDTFLRVENFIGTSVGDFFGFYGTTLSGFVYGGKGNDTIFAAGAVVRGDEGNDSLYGDASAEAIADTFWLQLGKGYDYVSNFELGTDLIRIRGSEFGIGHLLNSDEFFSRASDTTATGEKAQFIMKMDDSSLYFDSDGTGSEAATLIANLNVNVTRSDFEIV